MYIQPVVGDDLGSLPGGSSVVKPVIIPTPTVSCNMMCYIVVYVAACWVDRSIIPNQRLGSGWALVGADHHLST